MGRISIQPFTRSPLGWLLASSHAADQYRFIDTPASQVLAVLDELAAEGVEGRLAGGWGVDASSEGRPASRRHRLGDR